MEEEKINTPKPYSTFCKCDDKKPTIKAVWVVCENCKQVIKEGY